MYVQYSVQSPNMRHTSNGTHAPTIDLRYMSEIETIHSTSLTSTLLASKSENEAVRRLSDDQKKPPNGWYFADTNNVIITLHSRDQLKIKTIHLLTGCCYSNVLCPIDHTWTVYISSISNMNQSIQWTRKNMNGQPHADRHRHLILSWCYGLVHDAKL